VGKEDVIVEFARPLVAVLTLATGEWAPETVGGDEIAHRVLGNAEVVRIRRVQDPPDAGGDVDALGLVLFSERARD
jgi:hypothetical protein